jgi:hypothetical protein
VGIYGQFRLLACDPMKWNNVVGKFFRLAGGKMEAGLCRDLVARVGELENMMVQELCRLLRRAGDARKKSRLAAV